MRRCTSNHFGGPGVEITRGRCLHAGPLALAFLLGVLMIAAGVKGHCPVWMDVVGFFFWPAFSVFGQLVL